MMEDGTQASKRKLASDPGPDEASPSSNIVIRTFSSLFKRPRITSVERSSASGGKPAHDETGGEHIESNASPKLTSPLPKLNLASTRLNNSSTSKNSTGFKTSDGNVTGPPLRFSIGQATAADTGTDKKSNRRRNSYSRSRAISNLTRHSSSRGRSGNLLRKSSIGTFSVGDSTYSKTSQTQSMTKVPTSNTYNNRLLERRQKMRRRKKVTSSMNQDLVNRILEAGEGVLFPHRAISSDLAIGQSSSRNNRENQTVKVGAIGKYKVGGPRWNQPKSPKRNNSNDPTKPPTKSMVSKQNSTVSTSTSYSKGVTFDMKPQESNSKSKTSASPKRMPQIKTPANKQELKNQKTSPLPTFTTPTNITKTPPSSSVATTSTSLPSTSRKRPHEHLLVSDSADSEFLFQQAPIPKAMNSLINSLTPDHVKFELKTHLSAKKVRFEFSRPPESIEGVKKTVRKGTPYPQKQGKKKDKKISSALPFESLGDNDGKKEKMPLSPKPITQGWGANMFAKPGEWSCKVCMTKNPKHKTVCMACETEKEPKIESEKKSSEKNVFKMSENSEEKKDNAVSTPKFTFGVVKGDSQKSSGTTEFKANGDQKNDGVFAGGFSFGVKKEESKTPTPSKVGTSTGFGTFGTNESSSADNGFSFGVERKDTKPKSTPKSGFSFGIKKDDTKVNSTPSSGFTFGGKNENSKANASVTNESTNKPKIEIEKSSLSETGGFVFGSNKNKVENNSSSKGFQFAVEKSENSGGSGNEDKVKNTFSFGVPKNSKSTNDNIKPTKGFTFGTSELKKESIKGGTTSAQKTTLALDESISKPTSTTQPKSGNKVPDGTPTFSFGKTSAPPSFNSEPANIEKNSESRKKKRDFDSKTNGNETKSAPTFSFGSTATTTPTAPAQKTTKTPSSTTFQFGAPTPSNSSTATKSDPSSASTLQFGSTTAQASKMSTNQNFSFGSSSSSVLPKAPAPAPSATPAPSFGFGSTSAPTTATSSAPVASFTFNAGSSSVQTSDKTASLSFGATDTTATSAPNFSFGQQQQATAVPQKPQSSFSFGAATPGPTAPAAAQSFNYGANANMTPATPAVPQFSVGGFGSQATPSASGFGAPTTPATGGFGTPAAASNGGFNGGFGQGSSGMVMPVGGGFSIGTGGGGKKTPGKAGVTPRRRIKARRPPPLK